MGLISKPKMADTTPVVAFGSEPKQQDGSTAGTSNKRTMEELRNAKATHNSMGAVHGFAGLMAGFQGFIINEYVNVSGKPDEGTMDSVFEWGLFLMIISFALHIQSAILGFLWGVFIQEGLWRDWFMTRLGRVIKLMVTLGVSLFVLSVCLFVWTMNFRPAFYIVIYTVAGLFLSGGLILFAYTMLLMRTEGQSHVNEIMDLINEPPSDPLAAEPKS